MNAQIAKMMLSRHGLVEIKEIDNKSSDGSMSPVTKVVREIINATDHQNA